MLFDHRACCLTQLVLISVVIASVRACPSMCTCIWRSGKQTALCEKQGLISIPSGISSSTQVLDLNKNNFQILPARVFQERGLINLQKVFLAECKLGVIAEDAFAQLTNLIELDLSQNLLTHVPSKALRDCPNIRRLQLNGNPIQSVRADAFAKLSHLKSIDLSNCQIDIVESHAFRGLANIEFLKLDGNRLATLSPGVVGDLPALYSFDLHRNPWNCDCELRSAREWMVRNNVPQSIPPTCVAPQRLKGLMWNSLDIDDFACAPDILTISTELVRYEGSNATLSCQVKGIPEPKVFWYVDDGFYRNLSALLNRGEKYFIQEERTFGGVVTSSLIITGLDQNDAQSFVCQAENRAGFSTKNFTVQVLESSGWGVSGGWSKMDIAGAVTGILVAIVLIVVLVAIFLLRVRRPQSHADTKPASISNLKQFTPSVKVENGGSKTHVTVIGKDASEKRPDEGGSSYNGGMTPDYTKNGLNGYHPHKMPTNALQQQPHQLTEYQNNQYNANYHSYINNSYPKEVYNDYAMGLPPVAPSNPYQPPQASGYMDYNQSYSHDYPNASSDSYAYQQHNSSVEQLHHPSPAPFLHTPPSSQSSVVFKRAPTLGIGAPTVVRYSPDEGYAEENIPPYAILEGTEV